MYSILCLMCLLLSGLPCWLCFSLDAGFTIFMGGMETPPLCWDREFGEVTKLGTEGNPQQHKPAARHCGIPVLPAPRGCRALPQSWQLSRGHQLRVPQEPRERAGPTASPCCHVHRGEEQTLGGGG